jgi:hypothetical protein
VPTGLPEVGVESGHARELATVFGQVQVRRIAYRQPGQANLHPAEGLLNLPMECHSHGLRRLAAIESTRGSFDGAVEAIHRATGQQASGRCRPLPNAQRSTSTPSPSPGRHRRVPLVTCSCCPVMARGWSCEPTRCDRPGGSEDRAQAGDPAVQGREA